MGRELYGWKTPWGTLLLQSASTRGEPRSHYPTWHSDARDKPGRPDGLGDLGHTRKATAIRRTERWLAEHGVDPETARRFSD